MDKFSIHEAYIKELATEVDIHATRRGSIGATDTSVIMGLNPFKTVYQLWLEKTGRVHPEDISDKWPVRIGLASERMIASIYEEDFDVTVATPNGNPYEMKSRPWITASPDFFVNDKDVTHEILPDSKTIGKGLEIKTGKLTDKWGSIGSQEVPDNYYIQVMQCMMVTGLMEWDIAAELYGNTIEVRYYHLRYNDDVAEMIIEEVEDFWFNHVIPDIPPTEKTSLDLNKVISIKDSQKAANDEVLNDLNNMSELKSKKKILEEEIHRLEDKVKIYLDTHEVLINNDGDKLATFKSSDRTLLDSKSLKKNRPELYEDYTKKTTVRSFRSYV